MIITYVFDLNMESDRNESLFQHMHVYNYCAQTSFKYMKHT